MSALAGIGGAVALMLALAPGARARQSPDSAAAMLASDSLMRQAGPVLRWNVLARELLGRDLAARQRAPHRPAFYDGNNNSRLYALLGGAQYDALRTASAAMEGEVRAAAAAAAVLEVIFPRERAWIRRELENDRARLRSAGLSSATLRAAGRAGTTAARRWTGEAARELRAPAWSGAVPAGPGHWHGEGGPPSLALSIGLRPWFLRARDQFRPPAPPAPGSEPFRAALAAVRTATERRSRAETRTTWTWARNAATLWSEIAGGVILRRRLSETEAARVLMYLNMTLSDATVACWDAKLTYWLPRPSEIDPTIELSVPLPDFPAYPSAHATLFAAGAAVLGHLVPEEQPALDSLAREATTSRVVAGVHYPFDNAAGVRLGRQVGGAAIAALDAERPPAHDAVSR